MKESKAVCVTKQELNKFLYKFQEAATNKLDRDKTYTNDIESKRNYGCQFNNKRNNLLCTCRHVPKNRKNDMTYFSGATSQVYTYHGARNYTDVGVGSVKALQKKKVKRIYLPETKDRGVGSEDWTAHISRRNRQRDDESYYKNKRTSSKCVGGAVEYRKGSVISQKLSPILLTRSGTTSPSTPTLSVKNIEMGNNTVKRDLMSIATQVEYDLVKNTVNETIDTVPILGGSDRRKDKLYNKGKADDLLQRLDCIRKNPKAIETSISSDSFVQHVHNLEYPSQDKNSRMYLDHTENKLEVEYMNMFSSKDNDTKLDEEKPTQELKSASILRKRFEALRRGFVKRDDLKKNNAAVDKLSSETSVHSRRDVSIVSDPPSLEGRSYSNTKVGSPFHVNPVPEKPVYKKSNVSNKPYERIKDSTHSARFEYQDSNHEGVKGMFRLWGKKFNLEDEYYNKKKPIPVPSFQNKKSAKKSKKIKREAKTKEKNTKKAKKFSFFKKKTKDNPNEQAKIKKSITAGRCELSQGLMIKIGGNLPSLDDKNKVNNSEEIMHKHWLGKYLSQNNESRKSVKIRWNNTTYNNSSSTIFELMDTVYKDMGVALRPRHEIITDESSYFQSKTQRVNFACNEIEAWMIPKTHHNKPKQPFIHSKSTSKNSIEVTISNQRWLIDKSKAFSNKIEVVLHSNTSTLKGSSSSEYLRIDIPKGFFINASSSEEDKENQSSIEEVYNIVEYETEYDGKRTKDFEVGDHKINAIEATVSVRDDKDYKLNRQETVIKAPAAFKDVVIQGSNVNVPNRCNFIEVGIITQRDMRKAKKQMLKDPEFFTDEETDIKIHHTSKECEFAESFFQEYYRSWTPIGTDISSWCVSDSHLRCSSDNSKSSYQNQGDGSQSCPNIYDDFQATAVIPSKDCCGPCIPRQQINGSSDEKTGKSFTCKLFKKLKPKTIIGPYECCKRMHPKDSLEVSRRRAMYAVSNKSKWASPSYNDVNPNVVPSTEGKDPQDTVKDCTKFNDSDTQPNKKNTKKKTCKKHVSMPDCETVNETLAHQLADAIPEGILSFKGAGACEKCKKLKEECPKHAVINTGSVCKILDPLCKENCLNDKKAPCSKGTSLSDNSAICMNRPKSPTIHPAALSPRNAPVPCKPTPLSTQNRPADTSKLNPISKKCSPICPRLKKMSPCTQCKHCRSKTTSYEPPVKIPSNPRPPTPPCCKKLSFTNKSPIICPHFPPCMKTKCSQISPTHSVKNEISRPPRNNDPFLSPTQSERDHIICKPECYLSKNKKTSPLPSICNTPPCQKPTSPKSEVNNKFPCLERRPGSYQQLLDSVSCQPKQRPSPKNLNQCKENCPLLPRHSAQLMTPKQKKSEGQECKPNCANMPRIQERTQNLSPPSSLLAPTLSSSRGKHNKTKSKISGIFLKMKPSAKMTCSKDCLAWHGHKGDNVIRLSSNEKITIRLKQQTPSTEEIREGMNIKVKDIDGQTLYERREYMKDHHNPPSSVLGDMYKCSNVNTISTPITITNVQTSDMEHQTKTTDSRSNTSIANLIEIQFKLKVSRGDKTTEINIDNNEDYENKTNLNKVDDIQPQDVLIVKSTKEHLGQDVSQQSQNDINIRVVIKNYKPKVSIEKPDHHEDFSRKISQKFHTVSTGYSNICNGQHVENAYSLHRATVNLTSSTDKSKTRSCLSAESASTELPNQEHSNFSVTSNSTKPSKSEYTEDKSISSNRNSHITSQDFQNDTQDEDFKPISDIENQMSDATASYVNSNEIIKKPRNLKEKEDLLKEVFEKVDDTKNKSKMKHLGDVLKIILTSDSSVPEDLADTSHELAKDVTYASLKPTYFRDTDSMNNYYKHDSALSIPEEDNQKYHPTEEKNSECSAISVDTPDIEAQGCLCSALAERLNLCKTGEGSCCCRGTAKRNEETCCTLEKENSSQSNIEISEFANVETQNSMYMTSQNYSSQLNVKISNESSVIENCPLVFNQYKNVISSTQGIEYQNVKSCSTRNCYDKKCKINLNATATLHTSNQNETIIVKTKPKKYIRDLKSDEDKGKVEERRKKSTRCQKSKKEDLFTETKLDVLQSFETKRAVLEIYTENMILDNTVEHLVAKLPKFVHPTETEIKNYKQSVTNYRSVYERKNCISIHR